MIVETEPRATEDDFPYADREDLPDHERKISARSLAMLRTGVEDARQGRMSHLVLVTDPVDDDNHERKGAA